MAQQTRQDEERYNNGLTVYVLGGEPFPDMELIPGPHTLGQLNVSLTEGLDAQAVLERADAAAVADRQRAAPSNGSARWCKSPRT